MEGRNKGLVIFGIILLAIGLFGSFYQVTQRVGEPPLLVDYQVVTPYQNVGIISLVAGIILIAVGFLYSPRVTLPTLSFPKMLGVFLIMIGVVVSVLSQLGEADYVQLAQGTYTLAVAAYWVLTILGIATVIIGVMLIMWSNEKGRLLTPPPPPKA